MAVRPVFVPTPTEHALVRQALVDFRWHPGFSISQKQKSVRDLHQAAQGLGLRHLLEISTKSEVKLGTRLSAFNLKVSVPGVGDVPLENAFQGAKVFEQGGPYRDLYEVAPREAKRDVRLRTSGKLVAFTFGGEQWPLEPRTAFYDWLYVNAIYPHRVWLEEHRLHGYDGFTDIEFNPQRSLNCQARSCALFVALLVTRRLDEAVKNKSNFIAVVQDGSEPPSHDSGNQRPLF